MGRYFDFSGRTTRSGYWIFQLIVVLLALAAAIGDQLISPGERVQDGTMILVVAVVHLIPFWAITVRRLHDSGKSGWLALVGLVPLIGIIYLASLALTPSDEANNEHGPHPDAADFASRRSQQTSERREPGMFTAPPQSPAPLEQLEKLAALRNSGAIDEDEFRQMKARVMGSNGTSNVGR